MVGWICRTCGETHLVQLPQIGHVMGCRGCGQKAAVENNFTDRDLVAWATAKRVEARELKRARPALAKE